MACVGVRTGQMVRPPPKAHTSLKTHTHTNMNKMQTSHAIHNHTHPRGGGAVGCHGNYTRDQYIYRHWDMHNTIDTHDNPIPRDYQPTGSLRSIINCLLLTLALPAYNTSDMNVSSQFWHPRHIHTNIRTLQMLYQMTRAKVCLL